MMSFIRNRKELIIFDRLHCKKIMNDNNIKGAKEYIKYFFYPYNDKLFFFNGDEYILYNREDGLKLIPDDLKVFFINTKSKYKEI